MVVIIHFLNAHTSISHCFPPQLLIPKAAHLERFGMSENYALLVK